MGTDPRHLDATASSGGSGGGDWLVAQLQVLIDAGFKMATGPVEALRPLGVHLLQASTVHVCLICLTVQR